MGFKNPFLSSEWIDQLRRLAEEFHQATASRTPIRMNQVITGVPFGDGEIKAHLDTTSGEREVELGHLDSPDVTLVTDYATAKAIFVDGDLQTAMEAFMGGKVQVEGDTNKLLAFQTESLLNPRSEEFAERLRQITA